jgi:hypothetical protein
MFFISCFSFSPKLGCFKTTPVGKLIEQNPYGKDKFEPKKQINYPQTGEKPIFKKNDQKFEKKWSLFSLFNFFVHII